MKKSFWVRLVHTLAVLGAFIASAVPSDICFIAVYEPEMPSALNQSDK